MSPAWPRYLLFADTLNEGSSATGWRFMLQAIDSEHHVAASDFEPNMRGDRLALMAVVRGLEALDQPSAVKLVTTSNSIRRGVTRGLAEWKRNDWKWERFGRLTTVRDEDLWRRVDQAMQYHQLACRGWRRGADALGEQSPANRQRVATAVEQVVDGVINEPALLIVRGQRRRVVATDTPNGKAVGSGNRLAVAG